MKTVDILEVFVAAIEERIGKEWRHECFILGWSSEHINFEIDGKEYVLKMREIKDGCHWSMGGEKEWIKNESVCL